jgi:hypothetical protein
MKGDWRIRTNAELQELCLEHDLVAFIEKGRLRWLGHVERVELQQSSKANAVWQTRRKKGIP